MINSVISPDSKSAIEDVQAQNLICILDVDLQGVKNIKQTDLNPIYISIQPPSMEILVRHRHYGYFISFLIHQNRIWVQCCLFQVCGALHYI